MEKKKKDRKPQDMQMLSAGLSLLLSEGCSSWPIYPVITTGTLSTPGNCRVEIMMEVDGWSGTTYEANLGPWRVPWEGELKLKTLVK